MSNHLPVLAAEIQRVHTEAEAAATTSAERAIEAGRLLLEAKALVRHGGWLAFLAEAGMPARTAQRYMARAGEVMKPGRGLYVHPDHHNPLVPTVPKSQSGEGDAANWDIGTHKTGGRREESDPFEADWR